MRKQVAVALMAAAVATACATEPEVVPMGHDTYMVSRVGADLPQIGLLTPEALRAANRYCIDRHETMSVVTATGASFVHPILRSLPSGYQRVNVTFRCSPPKGTL